jgi:hypothetical protein
MQPWAALGLQLFMIGLSESLRTICLLLAALGLVQCLALLAFVLSIRQVRKEIKLLQDIRRTWRLSMESAVLVALDRQRRSLAQVGKMDGATSTAGPPVRDLPAHNSKP